MAIIAVLVAIAVPLFVGSLKDAQEATKNANIHSVRSTAVVKILNTKPEQDAGNKIYKAAAEGVRALYTYYKATATVDATGNITSIDIQGQDSAVEESVTKNDNGTYTVIAGVTNTDVLSGQTSAAAKGE